MKIVSLASSSLAAGLWFAILAAPFDTGAQGTPGKLSLAKAVTLAEELGKADAIKAKLHDKDKIEFHIELLKKDGTKIKIHLDPAGKQLVEKKKEKDKKDPKKDDPKKEADTPVVGKIKLTEAIGIAERLGGGEAIKADYHGKGEHPEFHIEVRTRDEAKVHIHLDPRGKRVAKE